MSISTASVLQAIRNGIAYGFDILDVTGLDSGTVYPILSRLERDGLVRSTWEDEDRAHASGRPARRYYAITADGRAALQEAVRRYALLMPGLGRSKRAR